MKYLLTPRARAFALTMLAATSLAVVEDAGADIRRPCPPQVAGDCIPQREPRPDPTPDPNHDYTATTGGIIPSHPSPVPGQTARLVGGVKTTISGARITTRVERPTAGQWSITRKPEGSLAELVVPTDVVESEKPYQRNITVDLPGRYEFSFSTCPNNCSFGVYREGPSVVYGSFDVPVLPLLDFAPHVPTLAANPPRPYNDADVICMNGIQGVTQPQWAMTTPWRNASSYVLLEGRARSSRPSGEDNFLNHNSNDFKMTITPDAPFEYLLNANDSKNVGADNSKKIEVEWEQAELPEGFRPMNGDRVSAYGYHAFDCGHGHSTEIHPPVLLATHRPRMIPLPSTQPLYLSKDASEPSTVGTNVWVGGVVTDVLVSAHAGEVTSNCSTSGLHQPAVQTCIGSPPSRRCDIERGACIRAPSPIRRVFEFNIYLPKNPAYLEGVPAGQEEAPLYVASHAHPDFAGAATPQPTITPVRSGNSTYLKVSVDLTSFTGAKWAQQIVAGWVLPDQRNHGMESWKVRLNSLTVHDDSEPTPLDDGDWRISVAIPNVTNEWTRIMNCDGCIESGDVVRPTSRDWEPNATLADGTLIGDLHLLPHQDARMRMYGYDSELLGDDLGSVNIPLDIRRAARAPSERARSTRPGNQSGHYTVDYSVLRSTAVPNAILTQAADALRSRFLFADANGTLEHTARTRRGSLPVDAPEEEEEGERLVAGAMTASQVRALATLNPAAVTTLVSEARRMVNQLLVTRTPAKVERKIAALREAVPAAIWNTQFGDLFPKR